MPSSQDWFPVKEKEKPAQKSVPDGEDRKVDGGKPPGNRNVNTPPRGRMGNRFALWYLLGMVGVMLAVHSLAPRAREGLIPYSSFKEKVRSGEITKVEIGPDLIVGLPKPKGTDPKSLA